MYMKKIWFAILLVFVSVCVLSHLQAQSGKSASPHFNHTTIYVVDLDKSSDFYEKVMQLEKISEPFHDNRHIWFSMGEHSQLHVVKGASAVQPHEINIHLAFSVPSLETFMAHLDKMNIKYGNWSGDSKLVQIRPDHVKQIYLQDPEGYWIEVNDDKF